MSNQKFAKYATSLAILLSLVSLVYVGYNFFNRGPEERLFRYVWGSIAWCLILWGSIIGFITCRKYNLEDEDARFFSYMSLAVLILLISYILAMTTAVVISLLLLVQILNRKKKIIQKYRNLHEGSIK